MTTIQANGYLTIADNYQLRMWRIKMNRCAGRLRVMLTKNKRPGPFRRLIQNFQPAYLRYHP